MGFFLGTIETRHPWICTTHLLTFKLSLDIFSTKTWSWIYFTLLRRHWSERKVGWRLPWFRRFCLSEIKKSNRIFIFTIIYKIEYWWNFDSFSNCKIFLISYFSKLNNFRKLIIFEIVKLGKFLKFSNWHFFEMS